jgi:hypothetical protein
VVAGRSRWSVPVAISAVVVVLCTVGWFRWHWPRHDPREYPNADDTVQIGFGSLEHDILPRYHVTLPCGTTDVHYADEESVIGPDGTLYLSFATTPRCLRQFIAGLGNGFQTPDWLAGGDLRFPADMRQEPFGWTYQVSTTYGVYAGDIDSINAATIVVGPSADHVVIRMEVNHY